MLALLRIWRPRHFWTERAAEQPGNLWKPAAWLVAALALGYMLVPVLFVTSQWAGHGLSPREFVRELTSQYRVLWLIPDLGRTAFVYSCDLHGVWERVQHAAYPWWLLPLASVNLMAPLPLLAACSGAERKTQWRALACWCVYSQFWLAALMYWFVVVAAGSALCNRVGGHEYLAWLAFPFHSRVLVPMLFAAWFGRWNWCALRYGLGFKRPAWRMVYIMVIACLWAWAALGAQELTLGIRL